MKLTNEDADLFYRLHWSLMFYANQKHKVIGNLESPDFKKQKPEDILKLNEKIFSHIDIIDSFVAENPPNFNKEELEIVKNWKKFIGGDFFIIAHLKDYTVFLGGDDNEPKAYGVLGLRSGIEEVVGHYLPIFVRTILLPFRGRIVYCGVLNCNNIHFGGGFRKSIQLDYQKARSKFGIITSLDSGIIEKKESDEELLRFYMRDETRRWENEEEIRKMLKRNPSLTNVYYQELGKYNAKRIRKKLSEIGVMSGTWIAVFDDTVIATGQDEEEVTKTVENLIPEGRRAYVHVFRYVEKLKGQKRGKTGIKGVEGGNPTQRL